MRDILIEADEIDAQEDTPVLDIIAFARSIDPATSVKVPYSEVPR